MGPWERYSKRVRPSRPQPAASGSILPSFNFGLKMMYVHSSPEDSEKEDDGHEFLALAPHVRRRIDQAFDQAVKEASPQGLQPETRSLNADSKTLGRGGVDEDVEGGGFIPPEDEDGGGGGFMPLEDAEGGFMIDEPQKSAGPRARSSSPSAPSHIPLSLIPRAVSLAHQPSPEMPNLVTLSSKSSTSRRTPMC